MSKAGRYVSYVIIVTCCTVLCDYCRAEHPTVEPFPKEFDKRYISYEDLLNKSPVFVHQDIVGYVQLSLDRNNEQLLVGARDSLFRLSLDNLTELETAPYPADNISLGLCTLKGQPQEDCHNFIRVLLRHQYTELGQVSDAIFTCGTNAFAPTCSWRHAQNLSHVFERLGGTGKAPYSPHYNSTAIMTEDGSFYGATVVDIRARDPAIYRSMGERAHLRTVQLNSKWLNEPDFISAYEIGDFVYFVFREVAVEFINCGKRIYSRVARVCKTDEGTGNVLTGQTWSTYLKARLNCSIPGEYPFYFDEVQSTYYQEDEQLLYAVFTTPMNSIAGSAVCVYNMSSFNTAFTGPYKYQDSSRSAWERHDNSEPLISCPVDRDTSKRSSLDEEEVSANEDAMLKAQKYQMMDLAVQPMTMGPFIYAYNERWTHVVVDNVPGKHNTTYQVLFVATEDGYLRKLLKNPNDPNITCLIEEIKIVPNGEPKPVKAIKLAPDKGSIFISTYEHILKVPVQRCQRFSYREQCTNANDPYCGWNEYTQSCSTAPYAQPNVHFWFSEMTGCPVVEYSVDGGWSSWSNWTTCSQVGSDPTGGDCLCRTRSCDNPKPLLTGRPCDGAGIEVTNCTAHGQWTDWGEWSSCSKTCGSTAIRSRQRYCSNPPPKFGGRLCIGADKEEEYCEGHKPCPRPPVASNWTQWTEWSTCSAECNGGLQTRRRRCSEPPPPTQMIPCNGNKDEWRLCNRHTCEDMERVTPWTPWVISNKTQGGWFEQRYRFMCRAKVPSRDMITARHEKSQSRFCFEGGRCHTSDIPLVPNRDGSWSVWSDWSECNRPCDSGLRWRQRVCNNPVPLGNGTDCRDHPVEGQECNTHTCQGVWGCWSEFTPCSSSCGTGIMFRRRECQSLPPGKPFSIPCEGDSQETLMCDMGSCGGIALASTADATESGRFTLTQLLIACGVCFLVGGAAALGLFAYIQKFILAMREAKENEQKMKQRNHSTSVIQFTLPRKPSLKSSASSQLSVDMFSVSNKSYDVESVMKENLLDYCDNTLEGPVSLRTFSLKDL